MCDRDTVIFDSERIWHAIEAADPRFDGWVFCGVKTTGIYCRPSCPARTPKRENVSFFASAAAAQAAGFRACKRCRPDATPGSPDWDLRADLVGRAMRLIADGVVDREGVRGLARPPGLHRAPCPSPARGCCGGRAAGARASTARANRADPARDECRADYGDRVCRWLSERAAVQRHDSGDLRRSRQRACACVRDVAGRRRTAACRPAPALPLPLDAQGLITFLGLRAVPGVEEVCDGAYRRSLRLPHGGGDGRAASGARIHRRALSPR